MLEDEHQQRVDALTKYAQATMLAMRAGVAAVGTTYAMLDDPTPKHGVKQFDRFSSDPSFDVGRLAEGSARFVLGGRKKVLLALDWTDFEDCDHTTLCLYVVTRHGRATPLLGKTHLESELRGRRTDLEHALVDEAARVLPEDVEVTLLADRGFGDQALYSALADDLRDRDVRQRPDRSHRPPRRRHRDRVRERPPARGRGGQARAPIQATPTLARSPDASPPATATGAPPSVSPRFPACSGLRDSPPRNRDRRARTRSPRAAGPTRPPARSARRRRARRRRSRPLPRAVQGSATGAPPRPKTRPSTRLRTADPAASGTALAAGGGRA